MTLFRDSKTMKTDKDLVMYNRSTGCPYASIARRVLSEYDVSYREIFIDRDNAARERVLAWTGFLSIPTIIVANPGEILPCEPVAPLEPLSSPRGIDRGTMITEARTDELEAWLRKHQFIE